MHLCSLLRIQVRQRPFLPYILHLMKKQGAEVVDTFGLNQIQTYPENARFYINDLVHSSTSNHISINQVAEFDFHKVTDTPVNVQFTPDKACLSIK